MEEAVRRVVGRMLVAVLAERLRPGVWRRAGKRVSVWARLAKWGCMSLTRTPIVRAVSDTLTKYNNRGILMHTK